MLVACVFPLKLLSMKAATLLEASGANLLGLVAGRFLTILSNLFLSLFRSRMIIWSFSALNDDLNG